MLDALGDGVTAKVNQQVTFLKGTGLVNLLESQGSSRLGISHLGENYFRVFPCEKILEHNQEQAGIQLALDFGTEGSVVSENPNPKKKTAQTIGKAILKDNEERPEKSKESLVIMTSSFLSDKGQSKPKSKPKPLSPNSNSTRTLPSPTNKLNKKKGVRGVQDTPQVQPESPAVYAVRRKKNKFVYSLKTWMF